jgi:hypothetical protein
VEDNSFRIMSAFKIDHGILQYLKWLLSFKPVKMRHYLFNPCTAFSHTIWRLYYPLFMALNDSFILPAFQVLVAGFFSQTLLACNGQWRYSET